MQNIFTILFPHPPKNFKKCLLHGCWSISIYGLHKSTWLKAPGEVQISTRGCCIKTVFSKAPDVAYPED